MRCLGCDRDNRADARYCDGCGAALARSCPGCGRELRAEARFCDGCSQPVEARPAGAADAAGSAPAEGRTPRSYTPRHLADRILHQRSAVEGERKHVTVLFADLVASTPLTQRLDPEEMHGLMDRSFQLILDQVHRYEGTVNQFTGDGVMALFGAPLALEGAPRRAVLAALGVQRALAPLNAEVVERHGLEFRMRIGIHSGLVVVGRIGDDLRMDYTAVGDTSNLADRLQGLAPPGSVVISDATRQLVEGYFDLRDLGRHPVKGVTEPVRAFEVVGERAVSGRLEASAATGLTPFVGREAERATLRAAFESTRGGRGQVVVVAGEAGIGKSRLLHQFRAEIGEGAAWLEGRCSSFQTTAAFLAVSDALRRYFGIEDRDDEPAASARLEAGVTRCGDDLDWTLAPLRGLLSLPTQDPQFEALDGMARRDETVRAVQALLLRIAEREPLVLVVEDLHWIDPASEEVFDCLVNAVPTARILMLLTCRPGYQPPFGERSYLVRLPVQALSAGDMSRMAASLVESSALPDELFALVSDKAEGNPFFVEEILKSLLEEGVLALEEGRLAVSRNLGEISVPDSIQDVLMARLDRLPEEPKRAIQVASVIGREFALRLLEAIREAGDRVQHVVGELRALELIYEKAAHPELAFMFKHALTHDVAYDSILLTRRRTLHRMVGAAIEELYRDRLGEHLEALAYHYERGDVPDRAVDYHVRAAERATAQYANHSAIEHCRRALALAERSSELLDPDRRRHVELLLASALECVSDFRGASAAFCRTAEACTEPAARARNHARAAWCAVWGHELERARELCESTVPLARGCGDAGSEALLLCADNLATLSSEGPHAVPDLGAEAVRLAERSGDPEALMASLGQHSLWLEMKGRFAEALAVGERAVALNRELHGPKVTAAAAWFLGLSIACLGDYGRAMKLFRGVADLCERAGDRAVRARLCNTIGWLCAEVGAHEQARSYNELSAELAHQLVTLGLVANAPEVHNNALINLANDWTSLGQPERALDLLEPIRESLTQPGDPWNRWRYSLHVFDGLARVALASGAPERALAHLDKELEGARWHELAKLEARALELRGRVRVAMDLRDEAREDLVAARAVAERIGYPPVVWRADSLGAELARRDGKRADAARLAGEARSRVERHAASLPDGELQRSLLALGRALVDDPLGAYP